MLLEAGVIAIETVRKRLQWQSVTFPVSRAASSRYSGVSLSTAWRRPTDTVQTRHMAEYCYQCLQ